MTGKATAIFKGFQVFQVLWQPCDTDINKHTVTLDCKDITQSQLMCMIAINGSEHMGNELPALALIEYTQREMGFKNARTIFYSSSKRD